MAPLPKPSQLSKPSKGWFLLKVRIRSELTLQRWLGDRGIEAYLPKRADKVVIRGKTHVEDRPLWPGWLFVSFEPLSAEWDVVHHRRCAFGLLCHGQRIVRFTDDDIGRAQALETERGNWSERKARWRYAVANLVRVTAGPFVGFTGPVQRQTSERGELRYVVAVDIFGRETPVELEEKALERA